MFNGKQSRITNIWSKVVEDKVGDVFSQVVVESTEPFEYEVNRRGNDIFLKAKGALANMPEGPIGVYDGLISKVTLSQFSSDAVLVGIKLEHPSEYKCKINVGIPVRTILTLERSFLVKLFKEKVIVIDPGHGGKDPGGKGPVNLLEKNVVVPVAGNLKKLFEQVGARAILTRTKDENVSFKNRIRIAKKENADLFISIHTHSNSDSKIGGVAVLFGTSSPGSSIIAGHVKEGLLKKLKLADRGVRESKNYAALAPIPAVEVEVVTITNWVEEGLLRSPTVHKKAAEGIFNGVKNYFASTWQHPADVKRVLQ